jgi:energy-coupling factor transporter transmembrane protein EcfT
VDSLREEYERVKMVMFIRGMSIENANFFQRIVRSGYLIKVVFTGVLEGVFDRSEALYSRNFTKNPSTDFKPLVWNKKDTVFLTLNLIILIGVFSGLLLGIYDFNYYPTFSGKFNKITLVFLFFTIFSGLYGIKEKKSDDKLQS